MISKCVKCGSSNNICSVKEFDEKVCIKCLALYYDLRDKEADKFKTRWLAHREKEE